MSSYVVRTTKEAARQIRKLPPQTRTRIQAKIDELAADARPPGCEKLQGNIPLYRVRVDDYRIIYRVEDEQLIITIVRTGHRRDVYRNLDRLP